MKRYNSKRYVANMLLWHSKEHRYIEPGDEVDLSHLTDDEVALLIKIDAVSKASPADVTERPVTEKPEEV